MKRWIVALAWYLLLWQAASSPAGQCSYTLTPASASYGSAAGGGSLTMSAGSSCSWTATTTNTWIHTTSAGTGNGTITYTVDANISASARTGAISAGGKTSVINQAAAPLSLGLALDNTSLVWQTGTNYPWYGTTPPAPSFDGMYSAASGNKYVPSSASWLQTTVVGPGTLGFWWKVDSDVTPPPPATPYSYDELEFDLNGVMQDQIMGQIDWNYRTYSIPPGTNTLTWQYVKDGQYNSGGDQGWLDQIIYTTNAPIPLFEALNTCGVTWTSGGNSNPTYWTGESAVTHDGQFAAQSGALTTSQESWLQAAANGATNISFWWKVSSQANYDFLEFYTNSVLARRISGEVDWQSNYFNLAPTTNLLKWRFVRTNAIFVAAGQSSAWLDQVTLNPPPKPQVVSYLTNLTLSTTSTNCQAFLPDLTGPGYLTLADNCSSVTVTQMPPAGTVLSSGISHVVLTAFGPSGNATQVTNTVVVADLTPPVVTLLGANPLTNECHTAFADPGATASDNCPGVLTLATNSTVNPNGTGVYTIQYIATDAAGNAATNTRTVYVVDSQPPVITVNGLNPMTVECHSAFTDPGATALDGCAGPVSVGTSGSVNGNSPGTYTIQYVATDASGNAATNTRTVYVVDTTPPTILQPVPSQTLVAGSNCTAVLPDLTLLLQVTDNCSGVINVAQDPPAGTVLPPGATNVVFWVDDGNGNTNTSSTLVTVQNQALPVIVTQPQCQTNAVGAQAVFSVAATACGALTYQWCFAGRELTGQTSPSLALNAAGSCDAGDYCVVVGNGSGSVTSVVARLTVINQPLTISPAGSMTIGTDSECGDIQLNAGSSYVWELNRASGSPGTNSDLLVAGGAIDLQATAANPFTIRLVSLTSSNVAGPLGDFVNAGAFSWTIASAGGGILNFDPGMFVLDTSGFSPAFTGTFGVSTNENSLLLTYSPPLVAPTLQAAQRMGSDGFQLSFSGPNGQPYRVLATVDLTVPVANWSVLTNAVFGTGPVTFIDGTTNYPRRFYRIGSP